MLREKYGLFPLLAGLLALALLDLSAAECRVTGGNIFYRGEGEQGEQDVQLTFSGRVTQVLLHPNNRWLFFVRVGCDGEFVDGIFRATEPKEPMLKYELWRASIEDHTRQRLYVHAEAGTDTPADDQGWAWLSVIQFSPSGELLYLGAAESVVSGAVLVIPVSGGEVRRLGSGNNTRIVQSFTYADTDYSGYIVTNQHRYWLLGGAYDWYWLYSPEWEEIAPIGPDLGRLLGMRGRLMQEPQENDSGR